MDTAVWQRLDIDDKGFIIHSCRCSNCGWYTLGLTKAYVKKNFLHCPHCGKKMIEPTQSNNSNTLNAFGEKVTE